MAVLLTAHCCPLRRHCGLISLDLFSIRPHFHYTLTQIIKMDELQVTLDKIGLLIYYETFVSYGFTTWDLLMGVAETELASMYVTRGHRRVGDRYPVRLLLLPFFP